jgi:hypothetical protein
MEGAMKTKAFFIVCLLFAHGFSLASVSVGTAGIRVPTEFYQICAWVPTEDKGNKELFACVADTRTERRIVITDQGEGLCMLQDREASKPNRWWVLGTKMKASHGGGYLAYDPSGKDAKVFLSRETMKAGVGTDWTIRKGVHSRVIQAASGEVKGWYLDLEAYEEEGKDGRSATAYRLILRKDGEGTAVHITQLYADAPAR